MSITIGREPLSVVVTTFNNAATLEQCLASVAWADDLVVLDSGSTDATVEIATKYNARLFTEPFRDYAPQKQSAIDKAAHSWVLLLDADECLTEAARAPIERALANPSASGFRLPRREQMFWTFQHESSWTNAHLRLFDRRRGHWEHSAPMVWPPSATYRDMRSIGSRVLPGVCYRRHLLGRYSLIWTKPG